MICLVTFRHRVAWRYDSSPFRISFRKHLSNLYSWNCKIHGSEFDDFNEPGKCMRFSNFTTQRDAPSPINMEQYNYSLDEKHIAKYPASPRGSSRLLRVHSSGKVTHHESFSTCFPKFFEEEDSHLVLNESPVLSARVFVRPCEINTKASPFEMMILDLGDLGADKTPDDDDPLELKVMLRRPDVREGDVFTDNATNGATAKFVVKRVIGTWFEEPSIGNGAECIVEMKRTSKCIPASAENILEIIGTVPIPPYLGRAVEPRDRQAYNNIYATPSCGVASGGSVAAPTAGLHFTKAVLDTIGAERISYLSLHVGAGTFKPVAVSDARDHAMHAESFAVSVGEIRRIVKALESGKRLVAVGTTSTRTLESLYWCGVKKLLDMDDAEENLTLDQEEWFYIQNHPNYRHLREKYSVAYILENLVGTRSDADVLSGRTRLMIAPNGYEMKVVQNLVTNFHAPDSTLLLLISAFLGSGEKVKFIYADAQRRGYRFLSYGDVCMFSKPDVS